MELASLPVRHSRQPASWALAGFGIGAVVGALVWMFLLGAAERPDLSDRPATATDRQAAGPLPRSIPALQAHLQTNPDDWRAWAALGLGYVDQARATGSPSLYPKADGAFERSLSLRPDGNVGALAGRGALANARHDFAAGLKLADEAQALDRSDPHAAAARGDALVELGRYDDAFASFQHLVDLAPGLASYTRAAYALELQGDIPGATRTLQLALRDAFTPHDVAFANFSLGDLAWNHGDFSGARRYYTAAASADPDAVGPKAGLARLHAASGAPGDAVAAWRDVVERAPLPEYVAELVNLYRVTGRRPEAQAQLELLGAQRALLTANGVNGDLELALFSADHRVDLDQGLAAAQAEWTRRPSIHAADALAWQLHAHGRPAEALPLADQALRLGTSNALFYFHRGMIKHALGETAGVRQDLSRALAINPHFSTIHAPAAAETLAGLDTGARR
ncbi:MAG TPA: tetratricopeptide repeat protein [Acidimicrobiia bacterium]